MKITLKTVAEKIRKCKKCRLYRTADKAVPGEGNPNAKIMLIGQAPGKKENKTGRPFAGRAGKFLDEQLEKKGIKRKNIFITSVVKHYPPKNRPPKKDEINTCLPYCIQQIHIINPKVVVLLGKTAENALLKNPALKNRKTLVLPHPAAAMRFPKLKKKFKKHIVALP